MDDNDPTKSNLTGEQFNILLAEARKKIDEIEALTKKAQSEALFAFQAKENCEAHSTFIAQKKGQVEADLNAITSQKKTIDELVAALPVAKASSESELKVIQTRRTEADAISQKTAELQKKIEIDATAAGEFRKKIETSSVEVTTYQQTTQTAAASATTHLANITASVASVTAETTKQRAVVNAALEAITAVKLASENSAAEAKTSASEAENSLAQLTQGNQKYKELTEALEKLRLESSNLRKQVEDLLPGATSAALASSFKQQAERFRSPKKYWIICFIICILSLIGIAVPGFISQLGANQQPTWDSLLLEFVHRLPILVPLVWLAVYSGRNYMMAVRMEEDYAFKEAVSRAFEGYKGQMQSIPASANGDTPLFVLCNNVLKALAERPGRIYEGAQKDITPANVIFDNATDAAKSLKNRGVSQ